ncbi:MAG: hypothetical protein ACI8QS_000288 [Planctomycetota bacterium]|jgi:hypothetical protein
MTPAWASSTRYGAVTIAVDAAAKPASNTRLIGTASSERDRHCLQRRGGPFEPEQIERSSDTDSGE